MRHSKNKIERLDRIPDAWVVLCLVGTCRLPGMWGLAQNDTVWRKLRLLKSSLGRSLGGLCRVSAVLNRLCKKKF